MMETAYLLDIVETGCEVRHCQFQNGTWRRQSTADSLARLSYVHLEDLDLNDLPRFNHYTGDTFIDSWLPPKTSYQISNETFQSLVEMNQCREQISRQHYHDFEEKII